MKNYDYVIVGGGSAGCTLAARLTEDPNVHVLLLEAGPDYTEDELPTELGSSHNLTVSHDWGFQSEPLAGGRRVPLPRGRVLGGCSATNATYAVRGHRADYAIWAEMLGREWQVDDVVAAFKKMEHDLDFQSELHGMGGPLPIRRYGKSELSPFQRAFLAAAETAGHARVADHNDLASIGAGPAPMTSLNVLRQSVARRYVWPQRTRENLTIRSGALVDRIRFDGTKAVAVVLADGNEVEGDRIVLSAGSYCTPAILMRSGVGPEEELAAHGIATTLAQPDVGAHLADHPLVVVAYAAPPPTLDGALRGTVESTPHYQTLLTFRSSLHQGDGYDMHIVPQTVLPMAESPTGAAFAFLCSVVRPRSTGRVTLASKDPNELPRIDTGYLQHPDDRKRLVECVRMARSLAMTAPLSDFAAMELAPGGGASDDEALGAFVDANVTTYFHPTSTCRMGTGKDAVVDVHGKVNGLDNLWIVDASVMPRIPAINTNLPTVMIAERAAGWLTAGK